MKLQYDISGTNNNIDLHILNQCTTDAIRYVKQSNSDATGVKIIQTTESDKFTVGFRMEVTLSEKEKS